MTDAQQAGQDGPGGAARGPRARPSAPQASDPHDVRRLQGRISLDAYRDLAGAVTAMQRGPAPGYSVRAFLEDALPVLNADLAQEHGADWPPATTLTRGGIHPAERADGRPRTLLQSWISTAIYRATIGTVNGIKADVLGEWSLRQHLETAIARWKASLEAEHNEGSVWPPADRPRQGRPST